MGMKDMEVDWKDSKQQRNFVITVIKKWDST
jgi:hypothetical protein